MEHPTGTVSFLFTDIEGSTQLWEERREDMSAALAVHDRIIRQAVEAFGGRVFSTGGDGVAAAFQRAVDALAAARHAQLELEVGSVPVPLRVRMAVHTGEVEERAGDYFGPPLNRTARLMAAGHGGQILVSGVTATLASGQLPHDTALRDLGDHRLRDLAEPEHVFQLLHPGLRSDFPPLRSLDRYPGNLPIQPTAFVGRDAAIAEVGKALDEARAVTLTGVGGVGKTRLALQVAADVVHRFGDGAWFVELAPVGTAEAFPDAVAQALSVPPRPGATLDQAVLDFLLGKDLLLVLDNCEHLLGASARFVESLLRQAPGLRVLATSREGLGVAGERTITVPSLEVPASGSSPADVLASEAVRLFVERARDADAAPGGADADPAVLADLCRRLDGIPLAIELAAARTSGMSPAEILGHLDRRFRLLNRGRRTATTRHQTLRNTLDWSYDLLDDAERTVLRRLAIFAGDFSLATAEAVVADEDLDSFEVIDHLVRLVEKSLVAVDRRSGNSRYRLLETIRDYAWERLTEAGEVDAVGARHAAHFLELALQADPGFEGTDELVWRDRVECDVDNLRAALRWYIDTGQAEPALQMTYALSDISSLRASPFGLLVLEVAAMAGAADLPLRTIALASACMTYTLLGELDKALALANEVEDRLGDLPPGPEHAKLRCRVRGCVTTTIAYHGEFGRLEALARAELDDARAIGDRYEVMRAVILLAGTLGSARADEALSFGEEGVALARELGVPSYLAFAPMILATRLLGSDPERAEVLAEQAVRAAEQARNGWARNTALQSQATVKAGRGDFAAAAQIDIEMAGAAHEAGDRGTRNNALLALAACLVHLDRTLDAVLITEWLRPRGVAVESTWGADSAGSVAYDAYDVAKVISGLQGVDEVTRARQIERAQSLDDAQMMAWLKTDVRLGAEPKAGVVSPTP